ncbi:MAG: transcriptional repressor [Candidatus Diapherotrites archaeon]|nr:transcriptional repressor [Candidatus Diapherotrites archaeon]
MGERNTVQMDKVYSFLMNSKAHPTAEMVFNSVKIEIPSITLATVYRNLNKLVEKGKAIKLEVNSEYRFDAELTNHQHCICTECGKIIDSFNEKISKTALKEFNSKEFKAEKTGIYFYGLCKKCLEAKK